MVQGTFQSKREHLAITAKLQRAGPVLPRASDCLLGSGRNVLDTGDQQDREITLAAIGLLNSDLGHITGSGENKSG